MAQETAHALVSHVIRRLTFSPTKDLVERFVKGSTSPQAAAKSAIE
jgi:hypothetical protein